MSTLISNLLPSPRREIVFVYPDVLVSQCCEIMADNNIGALMVCDDKNLLGVLSERDIVRRCLCRGLDINTSTAADIAFGDVSVLSLNDTLEKAMEAMIKQRRRHVLVKDKDEIIAILSIGDILYHLLEAQNQVIEHLENYITS